MMASNPPFPTPALLGMPPKFSQWREGQEEAIRSIVGCKTRFLVQSQPTGSGKSIVYVAGAILSQSRRAVILTSTKGLQNQLMLDFGGLGMVDIRGQNAYVCAKDTSVRVSEGQCHMGVNCEKKTDGGCPYYDALRKARSAHLLVTNYAFWFTIGKHAKEGGLNTPDLLIMDEAHDAPSTLMDAMTVTIREYDVKTLLEVDLPNYGQDMSRWRRWAKLTISESEARQESIKKGLFRKFTLTKNAQFHGIRHLQQRLRDLSQVNDAWFADRSTDELRVGVIKPKEGYAEDLLFQETPRIVMVSATATPTVAQLLGVPNSQMAYKCFPSTFSASRRPVYHVPTIRLNYQIPEQDIIRVWVSQIDRIIASRPGRKGIVHTQSYARAKLLEANSRHKTILYFHNRLNTRSIIRDFVAAKPPAVLVSPSVTTGYDFPYDQCRYQIVGKLPIPSFGDKMLMERAKHDKKLIDYLTMQSLVQSVGRGTRAADDFCETFIIDDSIQWWMARNAYMAPEWFLEAYKQVATIPPSSVMKEVSAILPF